MKDAKDRVFVVERVDNEAADYVLFGNKSFVANPNFLLGFRALGSPGRPPAEIPEASFRADNEFWVILRRARSRA
jgi:hypothetical protein